MMSGKPACIVVGVGSGTGEALVRRFADGGYRVAMIARKAERLARIAEEVPDAVSYPSDIGDLDGFRRTLRQIRDDLGVPKVVIQNAAMAAFAPDYLEIDIDKFEATFRVNVTSLLVTAQELAPAMVELGDAALLVTGNTGAWRGKPHFTGFAPAKSGQRILTEALGRQLWPEGLHVAYITIDALIDLWWVRERMGGDKPDDSYAKPAEIADEFFHVAHQPRSAWSFNVEIRPYADTW
jgi:NAD(P)-dependent dehydrogenase (short-subunit alcohol dehydrogenase family)